jgi:hypothetical protein
MNDGAGPRTGGRTAMARAIGRVARVNEPSMVWASAAGIVSITRSLHQQDELRPSVPAWQRRDMPEGGERSSSCRNNLEIT